MKRKYSAEEMRDAIFELKVFQDDKKTLLRIEDMLRQAADMVDRANNVINDNSKDIEYRYGEADIVLETAGFILTGERL